LLRGACRQVCFRTRAVFGKTRPVILRTARNHEVEILLLLTMENVRRR
jgi:hypothetical protein